jgi:hypothetical protein
MKDVLNLKIKRRESFRPFAPSVLREAVPEWFELEGEVPFMMQVYPIREDKRALIPAVTHVDGSGRLQTVSIAVNPRYHRLISAFHELTGVPMVLNTSFNENEPVVCTPQEALDCFLRSKMDVLVLGTRVIRRGQGPACCFTSPRSGATSSPRSRSSWRSGCSQWGFSPGASTAARPRPAWPRSRCSGSLRCRWSRST